MNLKKFLCSLLLFVCLAESRNLQQSPQKKGMTWVVAAWPLAENSWAASVGCNGCDPYNGDTSCNESRPILCLIDYKSLPRPFYNYQKRTSNAYADGGFYNGWTGGYYAATAPVVGNLLTSKAEADKLCQQSFGPTAQIMNHHLPRYMNYMNDEPLIWSKWNWSQTNGGGWYGWGYLRGSFSCTRMWTWILDQRGNCGN